ncbi:MAG: hypothetical protein C0626_00150 [Arcobacter sp.]|uniref:hypothetical protein n=1 Tax=uncultured Arcobacter sp. TaxID=165434 RepID=UPI000CC9A079|nr:hypothetical protein [uncultured Arcobacter sp.]PLY11021.1 MAG: hypothetical protein C0626_00150 [Arcobacter sp.]
MQLTEQKEFIKKNAYLIYEYINSEVLKNVGTLNPNFYIKLIDDIFVKQIDIKIGELNINVNILPYFIFTMLFGKGKMDYTSLRAETIDLTEINKESKIYYNYARFTLEDDFLCIDLMQTKIGGMPIEEDIVKFTKRIPVQNSGLEKFISKNRNISSETFKKIKEDIDNIL